MKIRAVLSHALMAYLFALGMVLTVLGVTGLLGDGLLSAVLLAGMSLICAGASMHRLAAIGLGGLAGTAGLVWLLLGGASLCAEVGTALILQLSGLPTALPMVHVPFTVLLCGLSMAASWFVTQRNAGAYPALVLLALTASMLWLGDKSDAAMGLLPGVFCCVILLLRAGDEHTSTLHVTPLAAAVTGVAALCLLLGGVTSQPMKSFAEDVRQRIYDTFFYTQPRDVFTLATEGYYPQGMSQLGGPATPREDPVMAVITPKKVYLRGVIKNVYTGRVWLDDMAGRRYLLSASRFDEIRNAVFDQSLPLLDAGTDSALLTARVLQVRMLRDSASTLFVPQRLRALAPEGNLIPYFNQSSEVFATSNLMVGDVWTVEAPLFTSMDRGVGELVQACEGSDPRWEDICDTYLQLPEHLQSEVYDIAQQAVYGADSDYAKAVSLQSYLASHYTYNLNVAEQNPQHDFVSTFLLETKEGYCTYFASAMTVLCRMAGLPARYVEGYVAYPDAEGLAYVTGKEGHAWTEVYFRNFGWVTFDATPTSAEYIPYSPDSSGGQPPEEPESSAAPSEAPAQTPEPTQEPMDTPSPVPESQPEPSPAPCEQPDGTQTKGNQPFIWGWLMLLALAAALVRLIIVQPGVQLLRAKSEFARWLIWTQAAHDALAGKGLRRRHAESPAAFFRRAEESGRVAVSLHELAKAENLMFYGHIAPLAVETKQAKQVFRALYRELPTRQRILFHLRRWAGKSAFQR